MKRFNFLFAAFWIPVALLNAEISENDLGAYIRPKVDQGKSLVAEEAKGVVGEIANTGLFQNWKTFEDDKVKFSYPDHAAITVEVKQNEPVLVDGDRVSDVDTSFSRAYRITAAGETLLVMMLDEADWLDDGVCFCGAVSYDRYLVREGSLYRFSFLEDGILKKMQVLGDGERLMMFEWTHLPMHPAVYRQIARTVELKKRGSWTESECRKRAQEDHGVLGVVGWFDEGSSVESVEKMLGNRTRTTADGVLVWEYPKTEDGYRWMEWLSLPFADGKLLRFDSGYYDSSWTQREAIKGGIPWMLQMAGQPEDPFSRTDEEKVLSAREKEELLALFLEKAQDEDAKFESLCQVLLILVEQGVKDEKAMAIVRKRFAAHGGYYAGMVLHKVGHPEDVTLFVDQVRKLYREAKDDTKGDGFSAIDLYDWLGCIPHDDKRYPDLLREGLRSPHPKIRNEAYTFLSSAPFPENEHIAFIHAGLEDPSEQVRYWSASCFDRIQTKHLDWALLRKAADKEKDMNTLKQMRQVLDKHSAAKVANEKKAPKSGHRVGGRSAKRRESK